MKEPLEQAVFMLSADLRFRLGLLAEVQRVSRSQIVREVLEDGLYRWAASREARGPQPAER